jgi:hypothetical protein
MARTETADALLLSIAEPAEESEAVYPPNDTSSVASQTDLAAKNLSALEEDYQTLVL